MRVGSTVQDRILCKECEVDRVAISLADHKRLIPCALYMTQLGFDPCTRKVPAPEHAQFHLRGINKPFQSGKDFQNHEKANEM